MYLWCILRNDNRGVDSGPGKPVSPYVLSCPHDVHSGNGARKPALLTRKLNDAKAVPESDYVLRTEMSLYHFDLHRFSRSVKVSRYFY